MSANKSDSRAMSGFYRLHALRMENDAAGFAMEAMRPRFDSLAHRHENGTAPRVVSVYQLFQTPPEIAARLVALLGLKLGARVLEPSAGLGRLLDALAPYDPSEIVAVENAAECAGELFRQDRAKVVIKQRDFLTIEPDELGLFDAVVMNPPFHLRADIRHIEHARQFLKADGVLAAICMDGPAREERLRPHASSWIRLEPGAFRAEGTNIDAVMLTMQTNSVLIPG